MDKNTIKINIKATNNFFAICKMKDAAGIVAAGNSQKFADVLANQTIIVNTTKSNRVYAYINPSIAAALETAGVNGYRIDGLSSAIDGESIFVDTYKFTRDGEYIINLDNGNVTPVLAPGETICKTCGAIINKSDKVGAYCMRCLYSDSIDSGLCHRYAYHAFDGRYNVYEDIDQTSVPVFGAEIERDYTSYNNFEENLNAATLAAAKCLYKGLKNRHTRRHVFMYDGSLYDGGIEWITYPATYEWYKKHATEIDAALEHMRKYNFDASSRAGNHIHISRRYFDGNNSSKDESRFAAAKLAVIFNTYYDRLCAIVGRDRYSTSYTTKPQQSKDDNIFTLVRKTLESESSHGVCINLQHNNTIEVRLFGAIKTAGDLLLDIDILQSAAKFVKTKSLEKCQTATLVDVFKYIKDKNHYTIIADRLTAAGYTDDAAVFSQKVGAPCV